MTILIYAPTSVGLGHTSYCLAMAEQIRAQDAEIPIVILSEVIDSRLLDAYPFPYYLMPPTDALTYDERWQGRRINPAAWGAHEAFFRQIVTAHAPSLILFDTFVPPRLHAVAIEYGVPEVVSLYRSGMLSQQLARYSEMFQPFELFIFPYEESEIDDPDLPWIIDMEKVVYGGPLMRSLGGPERITELKQRCALDEQRFTIVIANGGGTSHLSTYDRFFELVLRGLKQADPQMPPFQVMLITGPLHSHPDPYAVFEHGRLDVRDFEVHLRALYASANLTITRSGYNTRTELAALGVPAICIPLRASNDDQFNNLRALTATHSNLLFHQLEPDAIAETVLRIANRPWWQYQPQPQPEPLFAKTVVPKLLQIAHR